MSPTSKRAVRAPLVSALLVIATIAVPIAAARGGGEDPVRRSPVGERPQSVRVTSTQPAPSLRGVARYPDAIDVLVNKQVRLPAGFRPRDLVVPNVPFIFCGFDEKRQLRGVAARALERMFDAAAGDGVPLAGVSGYRSTATQRSLFALYVSQMGLTAASRVSARPGHSEHQTGLAIDVTGAGGMCPASSCFAGTRPARWIAMHAARYGFVVRYPADGEASTGYRYEPWHVRYLGRARAAVLAASQLTYEQFLADGAGAR